MMTAVLLHRVDALHYLDELLLSYQVASKSTGTRSQRSRAPDATLTLTGRMASKALALGWFSVYAGLFAARDAIVAADIPDCPPRHLLLYGKPGSCPSRCTQKIRITVIRLEPVY